LYKKQAVDLDHLDETKTYQQQLLASKAQSIANYELAQLGARIDQIKSQQARLKQAKMALMIGEWKARQKIIESPADGIIFDTYFQQGEYVPDAKPIASLLPIDGVRIEFFVSARDLARLELNQTVYFTCEGCAKTNEALIEYISPEAEYTPPLVYTRENSDKIVFRIKANIKRPQSFKPGQPVTITGFADAKS
jgi:HlyD family secretion protein